MSDKYFIIDGLDNLPDYICYWDKSGLLEKSPYEGLQNVILFYQDKKVTKEQAQAICDLLNNWNEDE